MVLWKDCIAYASGFKIVLLKRQGKILRITSATHQRHIYEDSICHLVVRKDWLVAATSYGSIQLIKTPKDESFKEIYSTGLRDMLNTPVTPWNDNLILAHHKVCCVE